MEKYALYEETSQDILQYNRHIFSIDQFHIFLMENLDWYFTFIFLMAMKLNLRNLAASQPQHQQTKLNLIF